MHNLLSLPRLVATGVLLAAMPAAVVLPPLVGLAGLVLIMAALIVVETTRYAQTRRDLRGASSRPAVDAKEKHQPTRRPAARRPEGASGVLPARLVRSSAQRVEQLNQLCRGPEP
jgi:hypothetical protein